MCLSLSLSPSMMVALSSELNTMPPSCAQVLLAPETSEFKEASFNVLFGRDCGSILIFLFGGDCDPILIFLFVETVA